MRRRGKKWLVVLTVGIVALLVLVPPISNLIRTAYQDRAVVEKLPAGYTDDVSRLDKTQIAENSLRDSGIVCVQILFVLKVQHLAVGCDADDRTRFVDSLVGNWIDYASFVGITR